MHLGWLVSLGFSWFLLFLTGLGLGLFYGEGGGGGAVGEGIVTCLGRRAHIRPLMGWVEVREDISLPWHEHAHIRHLSRVSATSANAVASSQ